MNGKILKLANNDLYGNQDERKIVVFACFNHVKYQNKYVIFTFEGEYDKNKLYYGSIHLKENSLVIFSIKDDLIPYITTFTSQYLSQNINTQEYQIIDITNLEKVELVSSNSIDCDKLSLLTDLSLPKPEVKLETKTNNKKPIFLYTLLIILILFAGGLTYLYLFPQAFLKEYKILNCQKESYNHEIPMSYKSTKIATFTEGDKLKDLEETSTYIFTTIEKYNDFKENDRQNEYFNSSGTYKYNDKKLELTITQKEKTIIDNYEEMYSYLKSEGYQCSEDTYYE